jgi:hypothetical protein
MNRASKQDANVKYNLNNYKIFQIKTSLKLSTSSSSSSKVSADCNSRVHWLKTEKYSRLYLEDSLVYKVLEAIKTLSVNRLFILWFQLFITLLLKKKSRHEVYSTYFKKLKLSLLAGQFTWPACFSPQQD